MRCDGREVIDTILRGIIVDEGFGRELSEIAYVCEREVMSPH